MSGAKDGWDKLQILAGMIGGILVPVAIGGVGYLLAESEKAASVQALHAERLTGFIDHLASSNPKQQQIAIEIANHLASTNQLPAEIVPTLTRIANQSSNAELAAGAAATALIAAGQDAVSARVVQTAFTNSPPRVYIHIATEQQRQQARDLEVYLEEHLRDAKLVVPGIELKAGPAATELRYFKQADKATAEAILSAIKAAGLTPGLVDLSANYENSKGIRPQHFELWFGRDSGA